MNRIDRKDARLIEAEGFRDGTQDVDPTSTVKEIEAQFARRQEQEDEGATDRIKLLEAQAETLQRRKEDTERHWADLEFRTETGPWTVAATKLKRASYIIHGRAGQQLRVRVRARNATDRPGPWSSPRRLQFGRP